MAITANCHVGTGSRYRIGQMHAVVTDRHAARRSRRRRSAARARGCPAAARRRSRTVCLILIGAGELAALRIVAGAAHLLVEEAAEVGHERRRTGARPRRRSRPAHQLRILCAALVLLVQLRFHGQLLRVRGAVHARQRLRDRLFHFRAAVGRGLLGRCHRQFARVPLSPASFALQAPPPASTAQTQTPRASRVMTARVRRPRRCFSNVRSTRHDDYSLQGDTPSSAAGCTAEAFMRGCQVGFATSCWYCMPSQR